jgi:hypothetical protein
LSPRSGFATNRPGRPDRRRFDATLKQRLTGIFNPIDAVI